MARNTRRGAAPSAATAPSMSSTSVQRSPATAVQAGRRSATIGTLAARGRLRRMRRHRRGIGMRGVDQHVDALVRRDRPQGPRRRRSRRPAPAPAGRPGAAVRPASESVTLRSRRPASRPASCRASLVPPRMRMCRMSSASPLAAHTAAPRRWLSIVGIGEDGVEGLTPGRARPDRRRRDRVRRQAPSGAGAAR